jgi:hypothetical protein
MDWLELAKLIPVISATLIIIEKVLGHSKSFKKSY